MSISGFKSCFDARRFPVLLVALVIWMGCSAGESGDGKSEIEKSQGVEVKIEQQWRGGNSGAEESKREVVRSSAEWKTTWELAHKNEDPMPEIPNVDFDAQMVIATFMGQKSTGGYAVEITKVEKSGNDLNVTVVETSPGPDDMTTQALTSPFHFVVVAQSGGEVSFAQN